MELIDVLNKLRAIENPTQEVKEAIAQTEAMTNESPDMKSKIVDWIKKYETRMGNNLDTLPEGYLQYFMSSGIFSDAYDQDETAKAEKMIGKSYDEWDYDDQAKALEMMPITKAMFDEIEQITGTSGEEAAEMVADVMDTMEESVQEAEHESGLDVPDLHHLKKEINDWYLKYDEYKGGNGDALPYGWIKGMTSTGVSSDGWEQDEIIAYEKKIGREEFEWEDEDYDNFINPTDAPITYNMFKELEAIIGMEADEEAAHAVADVLALGESVNEAEPYDGIPPNEKVLAKLNAEIQDLEKRIKKSADLGYFEDVRMMKGQLLDFKAMADVAEQGGYLAGLDTIVQDQLIDRYEDEGVDISKGSVGMDEAAEEDVVVVEPQMEPQMAPAVEPDMQNKDEAVDMAHGQLEFIKYAAQEIEDYLMRGMPLPEWMQNKLSRMHGNIMNLHAYIEGEEGKAGLNESRLAQPEDPNSVFARLMTDLSEIQNSAMDGNDVADDIADELGDYLRNGDAPEGSHYEEAISLMMDVIHDGPEEQAEAAYQAINLLNYKENEARGMNEGMYDGKSREELMKMKARAEADIKNFQAKGGNDPTGKFLDDTDMMMMKQHLDDINDALKKVSESKTTQDGSGPWYKEQRAKEAYEKANPGKRWADLPYGYKEEWRMKTESVNEASGEFAQPFYDLIDDYTGSEQIPQPWKTFIDQFVMDLDANEVEEFVDRFRREHDMNHPGEDDEYGEDDPNFESIEEAVEETVQVPVSELQDLLALAGVDASIEEWANTPMGSEEEPIYGDAEEQVIGLAGGLNRPKNQHSTAKDGDNAMAVESIKERLWAALQEQKERTEEGRGRGRGKKKTDEDEEVATEGRGRGKVMAGRGRGKVMAGRGRGKTNVMAGRGRGKN